ncbi:putative uncharacterized protein [Firmicutes bacterium CAG:170]|nr:putative uncharacterized protein [Firmicutes bacterium CAG:170]
MAARNARADTGIARVGGGRGRIGEDAEINVAQRAELGLEHDVLAGLLGLVEVGGRVADERRELGAEFLTPREHILELVGFGAVDVLDGQILPLQNGCQALFQILRIQQLAHHNGLFLILVGIDRRDAAQSGAVFLVLQAGFLQTVQRTVEREDDGRALGDLEILRRDGHARLLKLGDLAPEALQIDHNAVAEDVHNAGQTDAGRDQMQRELAVFVDDGVARVVAALIAADDVIFSGDEIDHTALSLVAPVDSNDRTIAHNRCSPFLPASSGGMAQYFKSIISIQTA